MSIISSAFAFQKCEKTDKKAVPMIAHLLCVPIGTTNFHKKFIFGDKRDAFDEYNGVLNISVIDFLLYDDIV